MSPKQRRSALGDSHNFGRRVQVRGKRIHKPRSLLWEWLLLAPDSPLRRELAALESDDLTPGAFAFLPSLRFEGLTPEGGEVSAIDLEPLRARSMGARASLCSIVGRAVALFSWLGLSDLHWENLALGMDGGGRIVFGPLDVEMIFADFGSPTETKLLPDADPEYALICQHAAGLRRVLPYLGKPVAPGDLVAMAEAYVTTLSFLDRHARRLGLALSRIPGLRTAPIRVCLRGTADYVSPDLDALWPPLLDAETEQLERGDIPYFFRRYGARGLHYFASADLSRVRRLPLSGDVPGLEPLLRVAQGMISPKRRRLRDEGLFSLLGAFDHPTFSGRYRAAGLEVRFSSRRLTAVLPSGEELSTGRDLRAFVSSMYQPCRCGEVRSVLVPSITRCSAMTGGV